jgi:hypothetical protein
MNSWQVYFAVYCVAYSDLQQTWNRKLGYGIVTRNKQLQGFSYYKVFLVTINE